MSCPILPFASGLALATDTHNIVVVIVLLLDNDDAIAITVVIVIIIAGNNVRANSVDAVVGTVFIKAAFIIVSSFVISTVVGTVLVKAAFVFVSSFVISAVVGTVLVRAAFVVVGSFVMTVFIRGFFNNFAFRLWLNVTCSSRYNESRNYKYILACA